MVYNNDTGIDDDDNMLKVKNDLKTTREVGYTPIQQRLAPTGVAHA